MWRIILVKGMLIFILFVTQSTGKILMMMQIMSTSERMGVAVEVDL